MDLQVPPNERKMKSEKPRKDDVVKFHNRNALALLAVFAFLLMVFFIFLEKQYRLNTDLEDKELVNDFQGQTSHFENLLAEVTSRVEGMRIRAESDLFERRLNPDLAPPAAFFSLSEADNGSRFHLDQVRSPLTREHVGNLTGRGSLTSGTSDFYRELYMALNLNPEFYAVSGAIKDAAWVYYTSASDFINIYPWVSSEDFRFSKDLHTHEFFILGTPEKNPKKDLFWTEVYMDEYGKGLMTTCAAPVYDQNRFLGTVAIDLTVDFLSTIVKKFRAGKGEMLLMNDRNQLLAHPFTATFPSRRIESPTTTFPEVLQSYVPEIIKITENQVSRFNGYKVLRYPLKHAPWQAFYFEAMPSPLKRFLDLVGIGSLVLISGLLIMVVAILTITHRQIVIPAGKLLRYIVMLSRGNLLLSYDDVPSFWKPWFRTIETIFRENEELTEEICKQNEELEQRVAERTAKLEESNRRLWTEIEERKRAEKEKEKLQAQLRRAQKMEAIGMLAGGVAHDLNNVLSGLVSYPQLLLMQMDEDSPFRNSILTIQKSGERAAAIVQDLLTLARRGVPVKEVVNLDEIIRDYLKSAEFKGLQLRHDHVQVIPNLEKRLLNILGSPVHLSKCIMNLVTNAVEAMPEGGIVEVSTGNCYIDRPVSGYDTVEAGDYVVLTVADSGIGISPEDRERIFEPFYTKKAMGKSGTGLGMAVVWGTVKDHNGYIDVQSAPGEGTTFTLYFPATRKEAEPFVLPESFKALKGRGETVLIVDDVREQRDIASMILQKLDYRPDSVASGEEAVEYVKHHSPDLIILDMIMDPGMDGLDTYRKIIEVRPGQKTILVSGFSETDRLREAQRLGAGEYVRKPYLIEKIALAVRKELDR